MSATIGTRASRTISLSAAVSSTVGHETRMMSAPASSQRRIWSIVACASEVGVLVIVWTLIGASPPTGTEPIMICRDLRRAISRQGRMEDIGGHIGAVVCAGKPRWRISKVNRDSYRIVLPRLTRTRWGRPMTKLARLPIFDRTARGEPGEGRTPRLRTRYYAFLSYSHQD